MADDVAFVTGGSRGVFRRSATALAVDDLAASK